MYILDCILKRIFPQKFGAEYDYNPLNEPIGDVDGCEHEFMPVDSTKEILACIKCGFIVKVNGNKKSKE